VQKVKENDLKEKGGAPQLGLASVNKTRSDIPNK
jgi:hypothetical protein